MVFLSVLLFLFEVSYKSRQSLSSSIKEFSISYEMFMIVWFEYNRYELEMAYLDYAFCNLSFNFPIW